MAKFHAETFPKIIDGRMRPIHTIAIGRYQKLPVRLPSAWSPVVAT
jgi:hypothetical protein